MKIETKFDIEDTVFFMYEDKIESGRIYGIYYLKDDKEMKKMYDVEFRRKKDGVLGQTIVKEPEAFLSREDLIETL